MSQGALFWRIYLDNFDGSKDPISPLCSCFSDIFPSLGRVVMLTVLHRRIPRVSHATSAASSSLMVWAVFVLMCLFLRVPFLIIFRLLVYVVAVEHSYGHR
jgi:hypothetical protein